MDNREQSSIYFIPDNFTNSGRVLGGLFKLRNLIEAGVLGYLLINLLELLLANTAHPTFYSIVIATPVIFAAVVGFQGDCLSNTVYMVFLYFRDRAKYRYRRIRAEKKNKFLTKRVKAKNKRKAFRTKK